MIVEIPTRIKTSRKADTNLPERIDDLLTPSPNGTVITAKIRPGSRFFRVLISDQQIIFECRNPPEKGKANREIIKELKRLTKYRVRIISDHNSKRKTLLFESIRPEEAREILPACTR